MFYDNKVCDGCGKKMKIDEDIVVCPVCGTPQHRECYEKNHCCVNEARHSEGFVWESPAEEKQEEKAALPADKPAEVSRPNTSPVIINPTETDMETLFMRGIKRDPEEEFDGIKVKEAASYIQNGAGKYITKFKRREGKKFFLSWNWGAFFFGPLWFFFRKMYRTGGIFLAIIVALNISLTGPIMSIAEKQDTFFEVMQDMSEAAEAYNKDKTPENEKAVTAIQNKVLALYKEMLPSTLMFLGIGFLLPAIIFGLVGNAFYKNKMVADIKRIRHEIQDKSQLNFAIIRKGGISLFAAFGAYMLETYLPAILLNIANLF